MMRSAAGRESAAAGSALQSAAQAMNTAALSLQDKGCAPFNLRPIKIAANLVLLIQM
jgi:hypothetical protein